MNLVILYVHPDPEQSILPLMLSLVNFGGLVGFGKCTRNNAGTRFTCSGSSGYGLMRP